MRMVLLAMPPRIVKKEMRSKRSLLPLARHGPTFLSRKVGKSICQTKKSLFQKITKS